ncbi:hypothetical protein [Nocardioides sp. 503]|uniref:hypothetical protein n=1 Tax=Nocardioides sp. 503 TaxID=2508326 RepID=UPI00142FBD46|nr:hypothetical protein [Nocardioides sp. 503]
MARGDVLRVEPRVATYESELGAVALVLVNRSESAVVRTTVDLRGFPDVARSGRHELEVPPLSWSLVELRRAAGTVASEDR